MVVVWTFHLILLVIVVVVFVVVFFFLFAHFCAHIHNSCIHVHFPLRFFFPTLFLSFLLTLALAPSLALLFHFRFFSALFPVVAYRDNLYGTIYIHVYLCVEFTIVNRRMARTKDEQQQNKSVSVIFEREANMCVWIWFQRCVLCRAKENAEKFN